MSNFRLVAQKAYVAINQSLTIRNWLTGFYIVEFEQNGEDRAEYGDKLIDRIAKETRSIKGLSKRNLQLFRQFYSSYPQIMQSVIAQFKPTQSDADAIWQSLISKAKHGSNQGDTIAQSVIAQSQAASFGVASDALINKLSYTHLIELSQISEPLKRAFYEVESVKGNWSVRELKRQIESLLFERTGLSKNKEKLIEYTNQTTQQITPEYITRDPYVFEFFGLRQQDILTEHSLEDLLIHHLQDFLLELGKGFCFEARQKRITIDNTHYYIDLLFYHKILKCNIIIELKNRKFRHEDASQLRVYLNYFRENEMTETDNPPVGILLCTDKSEELVRYATTGIEEQMFVSQYMLELPSEEQLQKFISMEKKLLGIE